MREAVQDLRLDSRLRMVDTPRAAAVLLVAGDLDPIDLDALARVHDSIPHPRATVLWQSSAAMSWQTEPSSVVVTDIDPVPQIRAAFRDLLGDRRPSESAVGGGSGLVEWRDVGPYGQGGMGMTGGTPYGRPMAGLGTDRDGLRLDVLPVRLGPFFPRLPVGLSLDISLAGDVLTEVHVEIPALPSPIGPRSIFARALSRPVPIADLESARARDHLRWTSDALLAQGMPALALVALRAAREVQPGDGARVRALAARVRRSGVFRWSLPRQPRLDGATIQGMGLGPVSRAAGLVEDVRLEDDGYLALGFQVQTIDAPGVGGWWQMRLDEAARSLDLAARAGGQMTTLLGRVEGPRGRIEAGDTPTQRALTLLPDVLDGLEWGDAMAVLVGLDLDLAEAPGSASRCTVAA